jgi:hypothetical protein
VEDDDTGAEVEENTKRETEKEKRAAQRYAKITNLLVEGKKGAELETVIAEWETVLMTRLGIVINPGLRRRLKTF